MTDKEKLEKIKKLADDMYYAAANLGPNVGSGERLRKTMEDYHKFIIHEYNKEEPDFKVGDTIELITDGFRVEVRQVLDDKYICDSGGTMIVVHKDNQYQWKLVEEYNITGIKSRHATGKLKECIDNKTEEGLEQARKQLEENPQECMYARDNYTDEDRKVLCDGCEEECEYALKEEPVSEDFESALEKKVREAQDWTYIEEEGGECPLNEEFGADDLEDFAKWGANWQKQQMMKDAVDVTVHIDNGNYPYIPQMELYDYDKDIPLAKEGDKYKVILIKE